MADTLVIRLSAPDADTCEWTVAGAADSGTLDQAAELTPGRRVVIVMPGADVLLTEVRLPARNRAKALAAIPWALEDRIVGDVEDQHFAVGPVSADGAWPVAIIERARMDACLALLAGAGIHAHAVLPAPLALTPPAEEGWTALEEATQVTLRTGRSAGLACEPELLDVVLAAEAVPARIDRYRVGDVDHADAWPPALADALAAGTAECIGHATELFTATVGSTAPINLLQGPYSRRERAGRHLRRWAAPAALAAVCLVIALAGGVVRYVELGARETALRQRIEQVFRDTFPDVQRVVNARSQMKTRLDAMRSGGHTTGFAEVLARAGSVMVERDDTRITGLTWRAGTLEIDLDAGGLQTLDRIQRALRDNGLNAEISGAERQDERVVGSIRITEQTG